MDGERDAPRSDVDIPRPARREEAGTRLSGEVAARGTGTNADSAVVRDERMTDASSAHRTPEQANHANGLGDHENDANGPVGRVDKTNGEAEPANGASKYEAHTGAAAGIEGRANGADATQTQANGAGTPANGEFLAHVPAGSASEGEERAHGANGKNSSGEHGDSGTAPEEHANELENTDEHENRADGKEARGNGAHGHGSEPHDETGEAHARDKNDGLNPEYPETDGEGTLKARGNANGANGVNGSGGGKNGANGSAAGSNGANGSGGGPTMEKRSSNADFREILTKGLAVCRRNLITVGIFSFIVNMLVLAIPIYLFNIADRVLSSQSVDTLVMLSIVVVGAILMHVLLDIARRIILLRVAVDMESKLGAPVLSAAARAAQDGSSREFQILGELQNLRAFITGPVILTMFDAPVAPLYLAAIFMIHPHLGFIVCSTVVILLVIAGLNQKTTAVPFGRANAFAARANLQADAMARNAQAMNAMGMIPEGVNIWGGETAESLKSQVIAQDRNILLAGSSKFIRLGTQIAVLGWGGFLAISGEVTGGMIIAASIIGSRALQPIEGTIEGWRAFVQARSAYSRIRALLLNSPLNFDRLRLPRPMGHLSVERVLYVPPPNKKVILNGVSFELQPGESLGIVGASGTGKTTLGKMLVGSVFPTSGSVRLDSMDLRNWDARQFGENVGYLPQDVQLFPASIKDNIARMRQDASDQDIFDAAEMADVHAMISDFAQGYETQVAMDGSPLSGGQKQRIGLARAFFGNPRLVVLDEPNSNLDSPGERALANALHVAKARQITVVAITQRPSLLKSVDKIMILKKGTVQALGDRDDIVPLITKNNQANGSAQAGDDARLINSN